ncbi:MAG: hypothetical protein ABW196_02825 [Solirubrobacterales bacterium]
MNWLKKGPELKLPKLKKPSLKRGGGGEGGSKGPSIKPPAFLTDLYYDMRDRRLLPVIALVLVAIVAVPFLMGSDPEPLPPLSAESASPESGTARTSSLTVVEATPGLRDYRKRLSGRSETDPFEQQYTGPGSAAGSSSEGGSDSASASSGDSSGSISLEVDEGESDEIVETAPSPGSGSGGDGSGGTDPGGDGRRFYGYRPNIRFGVAGSGDLIVHEHLPLGELLPQKQPILVFVGASENGNQVAFNLTREVTSVRGPGRCIGGKDDCSLLILRAGQAVDLATEAGQTFRLQVIQIDFVEVERPKPAGSSAKKRGSAFERFQSFIK